MPLSPWSCTNCGHWQQYFAMPPDCPICTDVRNDLPEDGWEFVTPEAILPRLTHHWREAIPGVWEFWSSPRYGLDGHGWLLLHPDGNVAFEAAPLYSEAALDQIEALGGIRHLGASHPHGYGALWQLQNRFQPELLIQRQDLQWTKAFRVTLPYDEVHEIRPGLTLHHIGGHYEGQALLHDAERGAVFCGDALKIEFDAAGKPEGISCHKAFHKQIPLSRDETRRYRDQFARLEFNTVFTPFDFAVGIDQTAVLAMLDALIEGPVHTRPALLKSIP
jgi:hypothetical protein